MSLSWSGTPGPLSSNWTLATSAMAARADARRWSARACAARCGPAWSDRLHGVAAQIQHRLDDLIAVERAAAAGSDRSRARSTTPGGASAASRWPTCCNSSWMLTGSLRGGMTGAEQRIDQRGEPIGFADDDRRVFAQRAILELPLEQLRGAAQPAERILDLVRELTNHRAAAADLRQQRVLAYDALVLRGVGDLDEKSSRSARRVERRDRHVDDARRCAVTALDRQFASRVLRCRCARAVDHAFELGVVTQQVLERTAAELVAARAEEILGLLVQVQHGAVGVDPDDARDDAVEQRAELGSGEPRKCARLSDHDGAGRRAALGRIAAGLRLPRALSA